MEHVQVLVEEWHGKLEKDMEKFGPVIARIKKEAEERERDDIEISRFGFVNAVLRRVHKHI